MVGLWSFFGQLVIGLWSAQCGQLVVSGQCVVRDQPVVSNWSVLSVCSFPGQPVVDLWSVGAVVSLWSV